jgi:hypothetical protein
VGKDGCKALFLREKTRKSPGECSEYHHQNPSSLTKLSYVKEKSMATGLCHKGIFLDAPPMDSAGRDAGKAKTIKSIGHYTPRHI